MQCDGCHNDKPIENRDLGLCATCNKRKRQEDERLYPEARRMYLRMACKLEWKCPVTETPITMGSDIHHKKGRIGYADKRRKAQEISLLIDIEYFLAVSRVGHQYIEANPRIAMEVGWTLTRKDVII